MSDGLGLVAAAVWADAAASCRGSAEFEAKLAGFAAAAVLTSQGRNTAATTTARVVVEVGRH